MGPWRGGEKAAKRAGDDGAANIGGEVGQRGGVASTKRRTLVARSGGVKGWQGGNSGGRSC